MDIFILYPIYPFSYSLIGLLTTIAGFDISQHHLIFLGVAGGVGTFLTIIDPFGWIVKETIQRKLKNSNDHDVKSLGYEKEYAIQAINTKSIGVEIDKIIGILYFAVTATIFIVAILFSQEFDNHFIISDKNNNTTCDAKCVRTLVGSFGGGFTTILILVGTSRWKELFDKVSIAGMHQLAISNEYAVTNSVENMTKAIDQNDWQTAKKWGEKIREEIKYKKGKREIVIKSAELVYKPLYAEFVRIRKVFDNLADVRIYPTINFGAWSSITRDLTHLIIDDSNFRERMDDFQYKTNKHDQLVATNHAMVVDTINKTASKIYGKEITNVEYFVGTKEGGTQPVALVNCELMGIHPMNYNANLSPYAVRIEYVENNEKSDQTMASKEEIDLFNRGWETINQEILNRDDMIQMLKLRAEIEVETLELLKVSEERFELQYKV